MLPGQTTDIGGRIWRVDDWKHPVQLPVDGSGVRARLLSAIEPWRASGQDAGLSSSLRAGRSISIVGVNRSEGVRVNLWPTNWVCRICRRVTTTQGTCICGADSWGQLPFVEFHECGYSGQPWIPKCATHNQVRVNSPGSSSLRDLKFDCPICGKEVQRGMPTWRKCPGCDQPGLSYNVHRAASVFSPLTFTMVNPARPEHVRDLMANGGTEKSLAWVLSGMPGERPSALPPTRQSMMATFIAQGLSAEIASESIDGMVRRGVEFADETGLANLGIPELHQEAARASALEIALATYEGRRSVTEMPGEPVGKELAQLYSNEYQSTLEAAGLEEIDFVDRFPILRAVFGYTRGGGPAGTQRLGTFRGVQDTVRVFADAGETEAYFLRLNPMRVARWLCNKGLIDSVPTTKREARLEILRICEFPARTEDVIDETAGSAVLTLLHSLSHRFIRQLGILAGVDRESLAEHALPQHLGVFVYATPRGEFVLGGLQSVFETELDRVLDQLVSAETRCPLDPACDRSGGACLACLHLGEPSCGFYNRFLDRNALFGPAGYFNVIAASGARED